MSDLMTIRFLSGAREFRMSDEAPEVGDVLKRNGDNWVVTEVSQDDDGKTVVTLNPEPFIEPEPDEPAT